MRFVLKLVQRPLAVVARIGHHLLYFASRFRFTKIGLCCVEGLFDRAGITLVTVVSLRGDDDLGLQVDRVLRLVCQVEAAVLHLPDPRVRVGGAFPLVVADLLAWLAVLVEAAKLLVVRIALAGLVQLPQVLSPIVTAVLANGALERSIRLQIGRIDAQRLAPEQSIIGGRLENQLESN